MEIIKWIGMCLGIFALIAISISWLIHSQEKQNKRNKAFRQSKKEMQELHKQLDETYETLQELNEPLEKVSDFFKKINTKYLSK